MLKRLMRGESLSEDEASNLLSVLIDEATTDAQIAGILTALALKGESIDELTGLAGAMRARSVRVISRHQQFIDTAGTGSSAVKTFNVSTAAAFVIAGAGLPVAKHGARAATSLSGSADVLGALGINIEAAPEVTATLLDEIGVCFMFAPLYHRATARVAKVRRELGTHTVFNLIGPLTNPANAPFQLLGVARPDMLEPLAHAALRLGVRRVWAVRGSDGLDEITLNGETKVAEAADGRVSTFTISPADFGLAPSSMNELQRSGAAENARVIADVLSGARRDAARSIVIINAAAALYIGGRATSLADGARAAQLSIESGAAQLKLEQFRTATNQQSSNQ
ncbi:MAG: anthranilate phosphoribosyltransferase [Pyrinomonadaceae bacterium]